MSYIDPDYDKGVEGDEAKSAPEQISVDIGWWEDSVVESQKRRFYQKQRYRVYDLVCVPMLQIGNVRSSGIGHVRLVMRSTNAVSVVDSLRCRE